MSSDRDELDQTRQFTYITIGELVGRYRIVGPIGAGGMGEVYEAHDAELDRTVALKFLPHRQSQDEDCRARFRREARAVARLNHPNIITIHEVSEHRNRPYFSMEHVEGMSLRDYMTTLDLSVERIVELVTQIVDGLAAAHEKGVTHRDIKPSNILVDTHGRVRIVDFGLAQVTGGEHLTKSGSTLGTLGYMSPEQVRGEKVDHRSDLFSVGVVLYELLAGQQPFRGDTEAATLHKIVTESPAAVTEHNREVPSTVERIVARLLEKDVSSRYQTAEELRDDLRGVIGDSQLEIEHAGPSIAVLPFSNLSADPDQEYFCDGIAEDIISDLIQVPKLRVVARTSAFAFKGKNEDVRQVGRKLNVEYVLEGSVRKGGDRLRITAQLIEVKSGFHLWSEKYDRQLQDIFAIQDDISQSIVEQLKLEFGLNAEARPTPGDESLEAYELYSQGRHQLNLRTPESFRSALELFRKSSRLAPDYPMARVGMADTYFMLFAYDLMSPRDAVASARTNAQRAIELKDTLADPYATLGGLLTFYDWAWADAEASFIRALELSPGHATAHQWYAELLTFVGRYAEAERHFEIAARYDPLSAILFTMFGWHYLRAGRSGRAIEMLQKSVELGSSNDFTYVLLGQAYRAGGDNDRGLEYLHKARVMSHDSPSSLATWGYAHAEMGQLDVVRQILEVLLAHQAEEYVPQPYLAALKLYLGDEEAAVEHLREAIRRRDAELIFMATMPSYAKVRENPRMAALLSVLGLGA